MLLKNAYSIIVMEFSIFINSASLLGWDGFYMSLSGMSNAANCAKFN